jgi:putative oxidoreductase
MRAIETPARLALSWVFIFSGQDVFRHPDKISKTAGPLLATIRARAPVDLPDDVALVRANAVVHVAAGAALALNIAPRAAATVLASSLLPTTAGGHAFWTHHDPAQRTNQRNHFNKNLGLAGGLLLVILNGKGGRS